MKKLFLILALAMTFTFASCNFGGESTEQPVEETSIEVVEIIDTTAIEENVAQNDVEIDTIVCDSIAE